MENRGAEKEAARMIRPVSKSFLLIDGGNAPLKDHANLSDTSDDIIDGSIWSFDPAEGLGYIRPINPGPLILARANVFLAGGFQRALSGAHIRLRVTEVHPYWHATEIVSIDETTAVPPPKLRQASEAEPESAWQRARCKWFDWQRGAGLLEIGKDKIRLLVESVTVRRSGLVQLVSDQELYVVWGFRGERRMIAAELKPYPAPQPPLSSDDVDYSKGKAATCNDRQSSKALSDETLLKDGPSLKDLCGMEEAVAWGLALAKDLEDFRQGKIAWRDVDPGAVLHGPPGTGKTMFAEALARSCEARFFATSYAAWQRHEDGHLGDVLRAMHDVFEKAKAATPAIIFIDELDAIPMRGRKRDYDAWWTSIVNALLEKLDGVSKRDGIVVIGACNHVATIDPAILRAGRLDRLIATHLPSTEALAKILRFHLADDAKTIKGIGEVALFCSGMTGADIARLVRDARRSARHENRPFRKAHLLRLLKGPGDISESIRRRTALHESGHAVAALVTGHARKVAVSIAAREGIRGQINILEPGPFETTRASYEKALLVALAGRAAEEVFLGEASAGAGGNEQSDLARATQVATDMLINLGVTGSLLWRGQMKADESTLFESDTAREVESILQAAYEQARELIARHRAEVEAVAERLLKKTALAHPEIAALIGNKNSMLAQES
jgi:ATP-dependent Zn protease